MWLVFLFVVFFLFSRAFQDGSESENNRETGLPPCLGGVYPEVPWTLAREF